MPTASSRLPNSFNNLLGYPARNKQEFWPKYISVSGIELAALVPARKTNTQDSVRVQKLERKLTSSGLSIPSGSPRLPVLPSGRKGCAMPARKGLSDRTRSLSQRQHRVIEMVAEGMKNGEIATLLGIRVHVVRNYVSAVYDKIGVSNRVELALWFEARRSENNSPTAIR